MHKGDKRECTFLRKKIQFLKILTFHRDLIFRLYQWFTTTHSNNRKENDDIWALTKSSKSKFVFSKKQKVHHIKHLLTLCNRFIKNTYSFAVNCRIIIKLYLISDLASKKSQIKKNEAFIFYFRSLGQKSKNDFVFGGNEDKKICFFKYIHCIEIK